jgi:hypothetical protein
MPEILRYRKRYLTSPKKLDFFKEFDVVDFSCGKFHSLFIANQTFTQNIQELGTFGTVYGCGINKNSQLGCNKKEIKALIKVMENKNIKFVSCGLNFSIIANTSNLLYLLTDSGENLGFTSFDTQISENVFTCDWFSSRNLNIKSIISSSKRAIFVIEKDHKLVN